MDVDSSLTDLENFALDAHGIRESLGRTYSGLPSSERARERQGRLIAAGVDVFGTTGYACAKIKTLCQAAGLSERYFYESFDSREDLLATIYDELANRLMENVVQAVNEPGLELLDSVRAGVSAVVHFMLDDPRNARIILVEIVGVSPELEAKRYSSLKNFATQSMRQLLLLSDIDQAAVEAQLAAGEGSSNLAATMDFARLTAVSMVGGVNNVLLDAILSGHIDNTESIIEVAHQLICNASAGIRNAAARG